LYEEEYGYIIHRAIRVLRRHRNAKQHIFIRRSIWSVEKWRPKHPVLPI
jgi:hypothetical protein